MDFLNIDSGAQWDESIESYQYHSYRPYSNSRLEYNDEVRITAQNQSDFILPSRSYLHLEGRITNADGSALAETTTLVNNSFLHLFSEIRYHINGVEVDCVRNPGIATTLKAIPSIGDAEGKLLANAGWLQRGCEDSMLKNGYFNASIPLSHMFGLHEDHDKIFIAGMHELILVRSRSDLNCYVSTNQVEARISLDRICWRVPHLSAADKVKLQLLKRIDKGDPIFVAFRKWTLSSYPELPVTDKQSWTVKTTSQLGKPRYIIIAFQTDRINSLARDSSVFDNCNLRSIKVFLNSRCYPHDVMNLNFERGHIAELYNMYVNFQTSYYGKSAQPLLSRKDFVETAPLVVIDCSKQDDTLMSGSVDVRVDFEASAPFPARTAAYCLVLSDETFWYHPLTGAVKMAI